MIEKMEWQGRTLALILRCGFDGQGVSFITPDDNPLQVGVLRHPRGLKIKPHIHRVSSRKVDSVQEVLHIEHVRVAVHFYDEDGQGVGGVTLNMGDTILLMAGGHGFDMLEDSKIIEVKQGPYEGVEQDKICFPGGVD